MTPEALLRDADVLSSERRYADGVLTIAAALEVALAACLSTRLVRGPSGQRNATHPEIQLLNKRYMATIGNLPLRGLCNVTMNIITRRLGASTIAKALDVIERSKRFGGSRPTAEQIAAIPDANARMVVESLRDTGIIDLRSAVVHQEREATEHDVAEYRKSIADLIAALQNVMGSHL